MDSMPNEPQTETDLPHQQVSQELAELADNVFETHAQRPAEQVRACCSSAARERGVELGDEMLERLSTEIASGNRVEIGPL